jgi:hypothetical protein
MPLSALRLALRRAMRAYVRAVRRADEDAARRAYDRVAGLSILLWAAANGLWPPAQAGAEGQRPDLKMLEFSGQRPGRSGG